MFAKEKMGEDEKEEEGKTEEDEQMGCARSWGRAGRSRGRGCL